MADHDRTYHVLVTRPEPGASRTAPALRAAGFEPVLLPVTSIEPITPLPPLPSDADAVVLTSANAVTQLNPLLIDQIKSKPCYVVGEVTQEAARIAGFSNIVSANGNARDLVELIGRLSERPRSVIYPCGRVRTPYLEEGLAREGVKTAPIEIYDTKKVSQLTQKIDRALAAATIDAIMFHSAHTLAVFFAEMSADMRHYLSDKPRIIAISNRCLQSLPEDWRDRSVVAEKPADGAMIEALRKALMT